MRTLTIHWRVKFRALGITFGTVKGSWAYEIPYKLDPFERVLVDERGVFIKAVVV